MRGIEMPGHCRLLALFLIALVTLGGCQSDSDKNSVSTNQTTDNPVTNTDNSNTAQGPQVTDLQIFASSYSLNVGDSTNFFAVGTFSDQTSEVLTDGVNWNVSDSQVATVATDGALVAVGIGTTTVSADKDGVTSNVITVWVSPPVQPPTANVTNVFVQVGQTTLAPGQSSPITVVVNYDTGSTTIATAAEVELLSCDDSVLQINDAQDPITMTGITNGTCDLVATVGGVLSDAVTITIADLTVGGGSWIDTDADFALTENDSLFSVVEYGGEAVMGTTSALTDIHSHYTGAGSDAWQGYEFTGRLTYDNLAGIGLTFYSDFPNSATYYRIRNTIGNRELRMSPLPFESLTGTTSSGVITDAGVWYEFKIQVANQTDRTDIKAKFWPETSSEPTSWQIDCFHDTPARLTSGTIGLWSLAAGHYWADLAINGADLPMSQPFALSLSNTNNTMQVGDTSNMTVMVTNPDGSTNNVTDQVAFELTNSSAVSVTPGSTAAVTALAAGTCGVKAVYQGFESNEVSLLVLPSGSVVSGMVTAVSQFGITWTFSQPYEVGQYANGDYWVVGPVNIVNINPPSVDVGNGWIKNGSMINPRAATIQGYDSKMYAQYGPHYDPVKNVSFGVSTANPLHVPVNSSLVSSISIDPALGNRRPALETCAILTVVPSPPPAGSFRPPYIQGSKAHNWNLSQLNLNLLPTSMAPIGGEPGFGGVASRFARPWLDHGTSWLVRYMHPRQNMHDYGRDMAVDISEATLLLCMNYPASQKMDLLVKFLQLGIDCWGIVEQTGGNTGAWHGNGGHGQGRKWPIIFAGMMFGHSGMSNVAFSNAIFAEDDQVYYVVETSPGVLNGGIGGFSYPEDIMLPEWSMRHAWSPHMDSKLWAPSYNNWYYRTCCTANSWGGYCLGALAMNAKTLWNNDAFFDYQDRYMAIEAARVGVGSYSRQVRPWVENMWDTYRANYGTVWVGSTVAPQ
ncbi:MAG: hypothetical protein AAF581_01225 [Planctomycetota bacterium]